MRNMIYNQQIRFQAIQIQNRIRFPYSYSQWRRCLETVDVCLLSSLFVANPSFISSKTVYDAASVMFKYRCADLVTVRQQMLNNKYTRFLSRNSPYFRVYDRDRAREASGFIGNGQGLPPVLEYGRGCGMSQDLSDSLNSFPCRF